MAKAQIGVTAYWKGYDRKLYLRAVQLAEDLGYDSFWVPETWGYNVFPLITEMAAVTKRIKLGTGIVNVFSRSPGLLAMSAQTMHEISDGRFILGVGTSGPKVVEGFHGVPFKRPLTQTRDVLKTVRGLLRGDSLDRVGAELARYRPFTLAAGKGQDHVPIYVAALKEKSIRSVGELADGWMPAFWPRNELHRGLGWLHEGARGAGRDPSELGVALLTAAIPSDAERALDIAREIIAFYIGGMGDFYRGLLSDCGFETECDEVARLYANRDTRKQATAAVTRDLVEAMSIVGTPLTCRRELAAMPQYGVTTTLIGMPSTGGWPVVSSYLRALAPTLIPTPFQIAANMASYAAGRLDRR